MNADFTKQQIQPLNHNFNTKIFINNLGGNFMSGWEILIVVAILYAIVN